jgi:hypothetical protein
MAQVGVRVTKVLLEKLKQQRVLEVDLRLGLPGAHS